MSFHLSVVTPVYNEETTLPAYLQRMKAVADRLAVSGTSLEIVLIDDHSTDRTPQIAREMVRSGPVPIKYVRLSRNSGAHTASTAGLRYAAGDAAVLIAVDLQDPPELILQMLELLQQGHDVVWAVRARREAESWRRQAASRIYYAIMRAIATADMPAQGADFVLVGRKVIDAYNAIPEKHSSLLAMVLWMGYRQTSIEYVKQARHSGKSKWTFSKKLKLFVDSVVSFSYVPIRFMSVLGFVMASLGFLYAISVVIGRLIGTVTPGTGFAALMTVLLVGQGCIMMMLGVLGEYLWRTYDEARGRPRYLVEDYQAADVLRNDRG
jgi:dolichol-phosphate mannosyltransferase